MAKVQYDYTNQAWLEDGRYVRCAHHYQVCKIDTGPIFQTAKEKATYCYGTQHVGEAPLGHPEIHP